MSRREFAQEMVQGTELVVDVTSRKINVRNFVAEYDNFFHRNALDGHEADAETADLLREFADIVSLHRAVQEQVVDQLYLGEGDLEQYLAAGRLLEDGALTRLREIVEAHQAVELLDQLRGDSS